MDMETPENEVPEEPDHETDILEEPAVEQLPHDDMAPEVSVKKPRQKRVNDQAPEDTRSNPSRLPLNRIKTFMKHDSRVDKVSADSVLMMAKLTEYFVQYVTQEAWNLADQANRKTINLADITRIVDSEQCLEFLEDM